MYKKNGAYWSKLILFYFKFLIQKKKITIPLLILCFVFPLNSYQFNKEDLVIERTIGNYRIAQKVKQVAAKYHIDPLLMTSVMVSESDAYQYAVSNKNARGLMQLMPFTALYIAKRVNKNLYAKLLKKPGLIYCPDINIEIAAIHLRDMYLYMAKRWDSALHIYNLSVNSFMKGRRNHSYVRGILTRFNHWKEI